MYRRNKNNISVLTWLSSMQYSKFSIKYISLLLFEAQKVSLAVLVVKKHSFATSATASLFFFFFLCFSFGGGGAHSNYFLIEAGPPKKILMKRGRHHILQELPVKFHQPPPPPPPQKTMNGPNSSACLFVCSLNFNQFFRKSPFCLLNFKE